MNPTLSDICKQSLLGRYYTTKHCGLSTFFFGSLKKAEIRKRKDVKTPNRVFSAVRDFANLFRIKLLKLTYYLIVSRAAGAGFVYSEQLPENTDYFVNEACEAGFVADAVA